MGRGKSLVPGGHKFFIQWLHDSEIMCGRFALPTPEELAGHFSVKKALILRLAIIEPEMYDRWLDPGAEEKNLLSLFTPFPDKKILAYPVGIEVNSPKNDSPNCLVEMKEK